MPQNLHRISVVLLVARAVHVQRYLLALAAAVVGALGVHGNLQLHLAAKTAPQSSLSGIALEKEKKKARMESKVCFLPAAAWV